MKVKKFVSQEMFSCNEYVVSIDNTNFIVDPGFYSKKVKDYILSLGGISFLLLTHGHYDHISGINEIINDFPSIKVYAYKEEIPLIMNPNKNCSSSRWDCPPQYKNYIPNCEILPLEEGKMTLENINFEVIHTPGHTFGGCMFYFKEENLLFTGDTILCESIGRYDLPTANESELFSSLKKVKDHNFPSETTCLFGHGEAFTYEKLLRVNMYLKKI